MTFMHFDAHTAAASQTVTNLSGGLLFKTVVAPSPPVSAGAQYSFAGVDNLSINQLKGFVNGGTYGDVALSYNQLSSSTDWVVPHDFTGSYWFRVSSVSGDDPTSITGGTPGVYPTPWFEVVAGSNQFIITWQVLSNVDASLSGTATVQVARSDGGPVLSSGDYSATVNGSIGSLDPLGPGLLD